MGIVVAAPMHRFALWLVVIAALLACFAFLRCGERADVAIEPTQDPAPLAPGSGDPQPLAHDAPIATRALATAPASGEVVHDVARGRSGPFPGSAPLRVVHEDGRPAVGATVWVDEDPYRHRLDARTEPSAPRIPTPNRMTWRAPPEWATILGVTDEEGLIHVRRSSSDSTIGATLVEGARAFRGWHSVSSLPVDGEPAQLEIAPSESVVVTVVTDEGAPVRGVPVGVVAGSDIRCAALTDADGRAHLVEWNGQWRVSREAGEDPVVRVFGVFRRPLAAPIAPEVHLALPPFGSLDIVVNAADGQGVSLGVLGADAAGAMYDTLLGGRVRFDVVEAGVPLEARLERAWHRPVRDYPAPVRAGASDHHVWSGIADERVRARLLRADGAPHAEQSIELTARRDRGGSTGMVVTDRDGYVLIEPRPDAKEIRLLGVDRRGTSLDFVEGCLDDAQIAIARVRGGGDLGDVILRPSPIVVAGRVEDRSGRGISDGWIHVRPVSEDGAALDDESLPVWRGSDGTFALAGKVHGARVQVVAVAPGFVRREVKVDVGRRDVVLVLDSEARLGVELALPPMALHGSMIVTVEHESGARNVTRARGGTFHGTWKFRHMVDGLESGRALVTVESVFGRKHHEERVDLVADATVTIGPVDLAASPSDWVELAVFDETGKLLPHVAVTASVDGRSLRGSIGGAYAVLLPRPPQGGIVEVSASGRRSQRSAIEGERIELELPLIPETVFRVHAACATLVRGERVSVTVQRIDARADSPSLTFDATMVQRVRIGEGRFQARLSGPNFVGRGIEFELTAEDIAAGREVELEFDPDEWIAAMIPRRAR